MAAPLRIWQTDHLNCGRRRATNSEGVPMRRLQVGVILGLMLALPMESTRAQQPSPVYVETIPPPVYTESPPSALPSEVCAPNRGWDGSYRSVRPAPTRPIGDWARRHDACCWSHHDLFSCGSLKSELIFLFGSCRAFYGETCLPRPDAIDHHGWYYRWGGY
jgi:hypothetical protein